MLALGVAAMIGVDAGLAGFTGDQGGLVGGVAASGGGELGEQGVDLGAQGGGGPQPDNPVGSDLSLDPLMKWAIGGCRSKESAL